MTQVRFEWGPVGGAQVARDAACAIVVDVLSFTTTVCCAVERGATVVPYPASGSAAETVAAEQGAALAGPRGSGLSLSPLSVLQTDPLPARLVLPSPNGAVVSELLAEITTVAAGSLRNARAVAAWAASLGGPIAVVAAGERWPDGSLRPAVEDLWGAGAVLAALENLDLDLTPEAAVAADAHRVIADREAGHLRACTTGLQLVDRGFERDVTIAADVDASTVVPLLGSAGFTGHTPWIGPSDRHLDPRRGTVGAHRWPSRRPSGGF